jgi:hypothetical protein
MRRLLWTDRESRFRAIVAVGLRGGKLNRSSCYRAKLFPYEMGTPRTCLSTETRTHKSRCIRPRVFQRCMAGGQIKTHPDRGKSGIPHHGKLCTNADGPRLPAFRPVPVVYPAILPAFENCMRSYRLSDMHCLDKRDLVLKSNSH